MSPRAEDDDAPEKVNFIHTAIAQDLESGAVTGPIHTRFPPEPNGYLHIGHAKALCVNFGLADRFGGVYNLRFDDTNPAKEETEFVDAIQEDVRWLGFDWKERLYFASAWFENLYEFAVELVEKELAYVCDLNQEETREYRGTVTKAGKNSPFRDRTVAENLDLLQRMRAGEFEDGSRTLRAKIDMASPNLNMRDPVLYRILRAHHHRTGDTWCIYPMYDFAHGQCDALEGITHSLCSLEFENHRPLYDWFLENISAPAKPRQIEFARLNLTYTVMQKRKLRILVEEKLVNGWDDPRMPTLCGLRRRGYTPESIRNFMDGIGVTKVDSMIDMVVLENALREDLNKRAERRMAVLHPLKVVIENFPEGEVEELQAINNPEDDSAGTRTVPFSREIWIEANDFREEAPRKFHRLKPGSEVRLRYGYCITCNEVIKDDNGAVIELRCSYDPETGNGQTPDGRKVKGIIHWVSAEHANEAEVRLYDHLFSNANPFDGPEDQDWKENLNPGNLEVLKNCKLEASLSKAEPGERFQFERLGYFIVDTTDSKPGAIVMNRAVSLRDSWAKIEKKAGK
ncbi:MAG: glutaminyl-tRNA synthetase [Planctomycetota bacterium]|jgi:glutaminyl-tRNA synthetase